MERLGLNDKSMKRTSEDRNKLKQEKSNWKKQIRESGGDPKKVLNRVELNK